MEAKLQEREEEFQRQQKKKEEELEKQRKMAIEGQHRLLEQKEIKEKLTTMVPKINEIMIMCLEMKRDDYLYEPAITTDVLADGKKVSRVVCKAYPKSSNSEDYNVIAFEDFEDVYY